MPIWSRAAGAQGRSDRTPFELPLSHALLLGALQGPTETLPVSSSAHITLVPWLLGWGYTGLDPGLRKAFEVGLHGAAGLALAVVLRDEISELLREPGRRSALLIALPLAPSVLLGYALERPIEGRLGAPGTVGAGLVLGGFAMACADRAPQRRSWRAAGARDALWLGLAQACALYPGVSRGGATLSAARLRHFTRPDAHRLSRQMALPVIVGASTLKGVRLATRSVPVQMRAPFLAGALAAFASTLASKPLLRIGDGGRPLAPFAAYRIALGAAVMIRVRSAQSTTMRR